MRILPAGPSALLVEVGSSQAVAALVAEIDRRRATGWPVQDVVPGAATVLLDGLADVAAVAEDLAGWQLEAAAGQCAHEADEADEAGRAVEVPCRYGGPDLESVAAHWGVSVDDVPAVHAGLDHRVAFCGFAPGFAYMTGLAHLGAVPRLATPRSSVPAGSVALAGDFTGIYPRPSPGGWRIIGRTDVVLFDPHRTPPALLPPGTAVRFVVR